MGYFAHVQPSRVLYNSITNHSDDPRAMNMFVVVAKDGPVPVYTKRQQSSATAGDDTSDTVATLNRGDVVRVSERHRNGWMKTCAPVEGWVQRYAPTKENLEGRGDFVLQLCALSKLSHARHGSCRPHGNTRQYYYDSVNHSL